MADPGMGPPPEAAAAAPAEGQEQSGDSQVTDLISNISNGLAMLTDAIGSVSPELGQAWQAFNEQYKQLVEQSMQGAQGGQPQPPTAAGSHGMSPEASANPGAQPAGMRY